jgi:hypothetical protein
MYSLENYPEIKTVPDAFEVLGGTLNILDDDVASEEGQFLVDGFITESTNSFGYSMSI